MKKINQSEKDLIRVVVSITISFIFAVGVFVVSEFIAKNTKDSYINAIANEQLLQIENKLYYIQNNDETIEELQSRVASSPRGGSSHWFLYAITDDEVLFERDENISNLVKNQSLGELENYYIKNGSDGATEFIQMIRENRNFSALLTKDDTYGRELVGVKIFEFGEKQYALGRALNESYILSAGNVNKNTLINRISGLVVGAVIISLVCWLVLTYNSKMSKIRRLTIELNDKNILIDGLNKRDFVEPTTTNDTKTGLYTKTFFNAIINKLEENPVEKLGIILLKIENLQQVKYEIGYENAQNLYDKIPQVISAGISDKEIAAELKNDLYGVIYIDMADDDIKENADKILEELKKTVQPITFKAVHATNDDGSTARAVLGSAFVLIDEE